jgi:membrane fusion protein (multidrug efflux system)
MSPSILVSWLNLKSDVAVCRPIRPKEGVRCAGILALLAAMCSTGCGNKEQAAPPPPPDVEVVEVAQRNVPVVKEWVATFDGKVNAQVRAQVAGYLLKQNYSNGAFVKQGAPLFQIDPRPFQAILDQAKANLAQARGNLDRAQAQLGKTQQDVARYTPLAKENAISQQELDDAVQANLGAKAQVATSNAAIEAAKAAIDTAQLNLGFTNIVSPVDGVAAIATAQVGDLVGPGSPALTTVSTIDPILVNFTPSEQEYLNAMRVSGGREEELRRRLDFQLTLADGSTYPHKGRLFAVNREVDVRTGAVLVQAEFPNPGNLLRPGGFGRISAVTRIQQGALLVPQSAVNELQGSYLVAVVGDDNKVSLRPVKVGAKVGTMWVVDEGLKPGERVIAEGGQKVREGVVVNPKPFQEKPAGKSS